jgi:hypothetical protein
VTDFDADEPVLPEKPVKRRFGLTSDTILGACGLLMAVGAAFFPWYVFMNQDKFTVVEGGAKIIRDLTEKPAPAFVQVSPMAVPDASDTASTAKAADPLTTAAIPTVGAPDRLDTEAPAQEQPFPQRSFKLLHASNGRALIQDPTGVYLVRVGSSLPDQSRLATIEERKGKWVIVTSEGAVIDQE